MKKRPRYTPERGDLVWLQLSPASGHEQSGHRPAVVLSPKVYNRKTGLCLVCPATRQQKGYPFEVVISREREETSVALSDQLRCIDWRARRARFIRRLPREVVDDIIQKASTLLADE